MKRTYQIFLLFLLNLIYGVSVFSQNNCECAICHVPCNAPLTAHKNPNCPVYKANHKSTTSSSSSGSTKNNSTALNNLIKIAANSNANTATAGEGFDKKIMENDPQEAALRSVNNKVRKVEDTQTVDLSELKDPYSAKADLTVLKEVKKVDDSEDMCKKAFAYKNNRLSELKNLLENSQNLISQQEKPVKNAQDEFERWKEERLEKIKEMIKDEIKEIIEDKIGEKLSAAGKSKEALWRYSVRASEVENQDKGELINFCNNLTTGLNTMTNYIEFNPVLKKSIEASPAKWVQMTIEYGPKLVDGLSLVYIQNEINNHTINVTKEKLKLDILKAKIESWKNEKTELENCKEEDCNCIRTIIWNHRPDLLNH